MKPLFPMWNCQYLIISSSSSIGFISSVFCLISFSHSEILALRFFKAESSLFCFFRSSISFFHLSILFFKSWIISEYEATFLFNCFFSSSNSLTWSWSASAFLILSVILEISAFFFSTFMLASFISFLVSANKRLASSTLNPRSDLLINSWPHLGHSIVSWSSDSRFLLTRLLSVISDSRFSSSDFFLFLLLFKSVVSSTWMFEISESIFTWRFFIFSNLLSYSAMSELASFILSLIPLIRSAVSSLSSISCLCSSSVSLRSDNLLT